jgi:hypothetical protein
MIRATDQAIAQRELSFYLLNCVLTIVHHNRHWPHGWILGRANDVFAWRQPGSGDFDRPCSRLSVQRSDQIAMPTATRATRTVPIAVVTIIWVQIPTDDAYALGLPGQTRSLRGAAAAIMGLRNHRLAGDRRS